MKFKLLIILFACMFTECKSQGKKLSYDLSIPDSVLFSISNRGTQVYGTHVFMVKPEGFQFNYSTNRLEKNDTTYIKVVETPTAGYDDKYSRFLEVIKAQSQEGFKTYYQKDFILQNKKAIILYGLDKSLTTEQIILLFGNGTGSTMVFSRFPANDHDSKNDIVKSLLTSCTFDSATIDISAIQNFTIDMLNTNFRYNSSTLQMFFYTLNGRGDPISKSNEDMIIIGQMPPMGSEDSIKQKARSMIGIYKSKGFNIIDHNENKITVNNIGAYEFVINGELKGRKSVIYGLIVGNSKTAILYQGVAFNNQEKYLQQFKEIAQTIKLK